MTCFLRLAFAGLSLAFIIITACGRHEIVPPEPIPVSPVDPVIRQKVIVAAFVATYCSSCKHDVPLLDERLRHLPPEIRDYIDFRFYVSDVNSQRDADKYRDSLKIYATAYVDSQGATFRKWAGGNSIPAAAVLSADEKVLKAFKGGNFDVIDIVQAAKVAVEK